MLRTFCSRSSCRSRCRCRSSKAKNRSQRGSSRSLKRFQVSKAKNYQLSDAISNAISYQLRNCSKLSLDHLRSFNSSDSAECSFRDWIITQASQHLWPCWPSKYLKMHIFGILHFFPILGAPMSCDLCSCISWWKHCWQCSWCPRKAGKVILHQMHQKHGQSWCKQESSLKFL